MAIKVGDTLPLDLKLKEMKDGAPKDVALGEIFKGKKVVLFAVPGAFTPTCSMKHLPGFVENAAALKTKGADEIVCLSVNDAFVMGAWGKTSGAGGKVRMLADGNGDFTRALGLELVAISRVLHGEARGHAASARFHWTRGVTWAYASGSQGGTAMTKRSFVLALVTGLVTLLARQGAATCDPTGADAADFTNARAAVAANCNCSPTSPHGVYVSCAADQAKATLVNKNCVGAVTRCAARSTCGKPGFVTCCRTRSNGVTKCSLKRAAGR